LIKEIPLKIQSLHGGAIRSALRFAKIRSIRVLGKLGKGFFVKIDCRLVELKRNSWRRSGSLFVLGMKCLKMFLVDAFVYASAVSIEYLGILPRFCKFNVNLLEVSL